MTRGGVARRAGPGRAAAVGGAGAAAMYRALYSFRSAEPNSLPFAAGETFLLLERSNQHWWLVTRAGSGETGYAPASYLQRLQVGGPGAPNRRGRRLCPGGGTSAPHGRGRVGVSGSRASPQSAPVWVWRGLPRVAFGGPFQPLAFCGSVCGSSCAVPSAAPAAPAALLGAVGAWVWWPC